MRPIVDGLEEEWSADVAFVYLNASDGDAGEEAFEWLELPGHPAILIYNADGDEIYRAFGVVAESALRDELNSVSGTS